MANLEVLCEFDTSIANSFVSTFSKGVSLSILSIAKTDELFTFHLLLVTKQKFELWSHLHHLSLIVTHYGYSKRQSLHDRTGVQVVKQAVETAQRQRFSDSLKIF